MGREPQRVEVITALAGLYLQDRRDPARALPLYERAAGLDPQRPAILVNLGVALLRAGLGTRAAEQFQKALSMDPGLAEAHYNLACARALLGDREGAEQALARAAALDPRSSQWAKDDPDLALLRAPKEANRP
jgi:tetratricopeptide (TPR) repeat protein